MELDIDDFEKSVTGVHSYLKIKLRQKPNQVCVFGCFLSFVVHMKYLFDLFRNPFFNWSYVIKALFMNFL